MKFLQYIGSLQISQAEYNPGGTEDGMYKDSSYQSSSSKPERVVVKRRLLCGAGQSLGDLWINWKEGSRPSEWLRLEHIKNLPNLINPWSERRTGNASEDKAMVVGAAWVWATEMPTDLFEDPISAGSFGPRQSARSAISRLPPSFNFNSATPHKTQAVVTKLWEMDLNNPVSGKDCAWWWWMREGLSEGVRTDGRPWSLLEKLTTLNTESAGKEPHLNAQVATPPHISKGDRVSRPRGVLRGWWPGCSSVNVTSMEGRGGMHSQSWPRKVGVGFAGEVTWRELCKIYFPFSKTRFRRYLFKGIGNITHSWKGWDKWSLLFWGDKVSRPPEEKREGCKGERGRLG